MRGERKLGLKKQSVDKKHPETKKDTIADCVGRSSAGLAIRRFALGSCKAHLPKTGEVSYVMQMLLLATTRHLIADQCWLFAGEDYSSVSAYPRDRRMALPMSSGWIHEQKPGLICYSRRRKMQPDRIKAMQ